MQSFGKLIKTLREQRSEPLRKVAAYLDIDQAILSKIEHGHRKANRSQVIKLAEYFEADEKKLLTSWLSDRILYELRDEEYAEEALKLAEEQVAYEKTPKVSLNRILDALKVELDKYPPVSKAFLFGSFARSDENYKSDIDILLDVPSEKDFSLFDMFEIQHNLENALGRKIDVVMKDAIKPFAWETAQHDLKLVYDRSEGQK